MDCDRFEATLIDELYEELDELTSAAAKRHVAGCSRCASLLGGLRATRRVALLPLVEPSVDLEDRIIAAARNAQKVVPIGRRVSRVVSWAGSWAMRPQTAMAAVFVLMVGSSLLFVRRSKVAALDSNVTVTAQGEPAPAGQAFATSADDQPATLDSKLAAAAHGAGPSAPPAAAPAAPAASAIAAGPSPTSAAAGYEGALALKDNDGRRPLSKSANAYGGADMARNAEAPAGAPPLGHPARIAPRVTDEATLQNDLDKEKQTASTGTAPAQNQQIDQSRASATDWGAALRAARGVRDTNGCGVGVATFDQIGNDAWGTSAGYNATWEAAQCYKALGQNDQALARYRRLLTVQGFSQQASQGIASVSQGQGQGAVAGKLAARKAAPAKADPSPAQPPAASPPAAPPPPAAPATRAY